VYSISVRICSLRKQMGPVILIALTARYTPTLISCIGTSWICIGNFLIVRGHASSELKPSFTAKQHKCGIYHLTHEGTSSQNSLVLRDLCCRVFGSQSLSIDISAALLYHFVPMMQTRPFSVQVDFIFLN